MEGDDVLVEGSRASNGGSSADPFAIDGQIKKAKIRTRLKTLEEVTITPKLDYQRIGIVGREKELDTLQACIFQAAQKPAVEKIIRKEFVVIQGDSGVGKSKIAEAANTYAEEFGNGIVLRGKFDQNSYAAPFSGISAVFGELFEKILDGKDDKGLASLKKSLSTELVAEIELLQRLIPSLSEVASLESETSPEDIDNNYEAEYERLKNAFRVLTRLLCSHFTPLVLILDDLQWSDTASLQTVDFLLSDTDNEYGLVVIGLYRSDEVSDTHFLTHTLSALESKSIMFRLNITRIEVQNLDVTGVNAIIMRMLGITDDTMTVGLAELCFQKTRGNPFFVIEFMRMLEMENMMSFNIGLLRWIWEEQAIEELTTSTANVVDLLQVKMKRLSESLQILMHYAACLGGDFKLYALETALTQSTSKEANAIAKESIPDMLQELQDGSYIEKKGPDSFRWLHDKIQEAALSYGLALQPSFQYDVGWALFRNLTGNEFEEMLFKIVDLINKGTFTQRLDFAKLNFKAAKKARRISAFHSAASYAEIGIKFLPDNKWEEHSSLALKLYTLGAEMEVTLGNTNTADQYIKEVLLQRQLSQIEKFPMYIAKSQKLCNIESKHKEAAEFLCQTLRDFGYWVPNGVLQSFHVKRMLKRTVTLAKKRPISEYETPKPMTNEKDKAAMSFLSRIFYASLYAGSKFLLVFSTCRMVQMTLDLGVSSLSGVAYASFAMIINTMMDDPKTSAFFAETAMVIQQSIKSRYMECQTIYLCCQIVFPWTKPLESQLDQLRRAQSLGMRSGNLEYGLWSQHVVGLCFPYIMGKPLDGIVKACERMIPIMEDLKQNEHTWATRSGWQLVLNLQGLSHNELALEGAALQKDEGSESKAVRVLQAFFQSELYLFFGQHKLAADSALERGDEFPEVISGSWVMIEAFHRAIALYAVARRSSDSKYLKEANKLRLRISKWAIENPNVKYYDHCLQAEQAAIKRIYKLAKEQFTEAINIAARSGCFHHAGLFNERLADMFENDAMDDDMAFHYMKDAMKWYAKWGADLKAELLDTLVTKKEKHMMNNSAMSLGFDVEG